MTGPSSSPRGERAGTRGSYWETALVTAEVVVDTDDGESPFGWRELDTPPGASEPSPPNRETRRALARAARRHK